MGNHGDIVRQTHSAVLPPEWSLKRRKALHQILYDFLFAPLRMVVLPDMTSESLHLTSLRSERFAAVLPELRGRLLDIGAGDNVLVRLYKELSTGNGGSNQPDAERSVGVDVIDWGGEVALIESADKLPFADASFDTVTFIACINHIPERVRALAEVQRVLKPGGRVVLTMIGRIIGEIGHKLWWYSEDKHRDVDEDELMGMDIDEVTNLLASAGFVKIDVSSFLYGLNKLYVANKPI